MRVVKQFVAVAAVAVIGGQVVAAVQDDPWLTLVLGSLTAPGAGRQPGGVFLVRASIPTGSPS